ncbi:MAG: LCP family protein, partial [Oscillospiraceae bacterium]|nr:LCP family protein [Oscillospiraceae bacterium]
RRDSVFAPYMSEPEDETEEPQLMPGESLDGHSVGTILLNLDRGYTSQAMRILRKDTDIEAVVFEDFGGMMDAFRNGEIDAIIYNEAYLGVYLGEDNDFYEWAVESRSIGIETEHNVSVRKADVISEPFLVYISGLDTWDEDYFPDEARCDVNIVAAVDPVNKRILLVNTPRDYYVPLWGVSYAMDKLTHAGVYGVEGSMETLEALYGIEFNYYVRTNIYSLIKIVDALGGITVHSEFDFTAPNGIGGYHTFHVGENEIDGAAALCFIRERYSFDNGDRQRGIHQEECIRAIINKACSPAIIAHFTDVLNVVESSIRTNIDQEDVNALIKMQLTDMSSWSLEAIAADGYGSHEPSYAMGGEELYVMIPYYSTVEAAREKLYEYMGY